MFFSIVMPVYNARDTVEAAVRSVLEQSFADFEIVAVNDGSSDESGEILERLSGEDARFRAVTVPNGGVSAARNLGIDLARGDYILFLDSDDELAPGLLERLRGELGENPADIMIFGFVLTDERKKPVNTYGFEAGIYKSREELGSKLAEIYRSNLLNQVWNKAFRADFLRASGVRFEKYQYGEDRIFCLDALEHGRRVAIIDFTGYIYVVKLYGSLISNFNAEKFEVCRIIDAKIRRIAAGSGGLTKADAGMLDYMFIKSVVACLVQVFDKTCPISRRGKREYFREILNHPDVLRKRSPFPGAGPAYRLLSAVMASRWVWLNMLAARAVFCAKSKTPGVFVKIKHR